MAMPELHSAAFPTLNDKQLDELGPCAQIEPRDFAEGEVLVQPGQRDFPMFVVLSGAIDIIDSTSGEPRVMVSHHRGQFTGDVSHLTGSAAILGAVARGNLRAYEIPRPLIGQLLNRCPNLSDLVMQAFIARRQLMHQSPEFTGLRVVGSRYSQDTFRVREFLARNRVPFTWIDVETDPGVEELLKQFGVSADETPIVACAFKMVLRNPSNQEMAEVLGIRQATQCALYDFAVVGAGPAGLAAAVYAASEGLKTIVLENSAPGGQAGSSMRIENYLGFPMGITGDELTGRAALQAQKFGARIDVASPTKSLTFENGYPILHLEDDSYLAARCLLIATGAQYNRLEVPGCSQFEGAGVYYAATPIEAQMCQGTEVLVVGGGNSAGQAAVFLSQQVRKVHLLIRGDDLYKNMSSYLVRRIEQTPNIELRCSTQIREMCGNGHLDAVEIHNTKSGESRRIDTPAVFSFIGATPRTDWLPDEIERDPRGFLRTGPELAASPGWTLKRQPYLLETSHPGVFAAGDVRSGSVKRVASAVGEGAMAVQFVHEYLKQM